jgi:hypothetical protein
MKKLRFTILIISTFALLATACMPTQLEGEIPPTGQEVTTTNELVGSLEDAGRAVSIAGEVNQPFIPVTGRLIQLDGQDVQVFEFATQQERQQISDTIAREGFSIEGLAPGVQDPNIWAQGRLIVIYPGTDQATVSTLSSMLGERLALEGQPPAVRPPDVAPEAVIEAMSALAAQVGVPVQQVQLVEFTHREWPDSCLGAADPNEACLQVITPGYQVILEVNGARYEVRTDETGSQIRFVN